MKRAQTTAVSKAAIAASRRYPERTVWYFRQGNNECFVIGGNNVEAFKNSGIAQIVMEDVWNGFDDLEDAGWEKVQKIECPVCKGEFQREDMTFTRDCHGITFRLVCFGCYEKVMEKGYDGEYYTEADECIEEDY